MEAQFEVQSVIGEKELRPAYYVYFFKKKKIWTYAIFVLGSLIALGSLVEIIDAIDANYWTAFVTSGYGLLYLIFFLAGLSAFVFPYYRINATAKNEYKNHVASHLPPQTLRKISDNGIESANEQGQSITFWSQFSDGYLYKNYIILFMGNSFMSLNLANVTLGTPEDLVEFVKSKILLK